MELIMKHCEDTTAIINRLKRIEGQVRGVMNMIEEGKDCEDVLIQISSVKSALHKTGQFILERHLYTCVLDGIRDGKEEETMKRLSSAIEQFSRII
ncbi:MAG: metal-sensitive transcriptional regulator [Oscillospiraceae bacterium]|jgi:DNA-binding FrmR family transcriptional regulator|nr:metal-sensitive transcriptional regulator [Oscillospiraceae bacterium]